MRPNPYPYYTIWSGSLNLGDTPGVFNDSSFVGLMLQVPINISFIPNKPFIEVMLMTNEVEIFNGKVHFAYFDWIAGNPLPTPIGQIDDVDIIPGRKEYHLLKIDTSNLVVGNHTVTIIVNTEIAAGLRDDFILHKIDADNDAGLRVGAL